MTARRRADESARPPKARGRPDLATAVYEQLRELIVSLSLAPGTVLAELDLCRRLHVSRTPVRAALQRLQQEGLIIASTAGSAARATASPLTADDMRELFLMVGALDGVAARLAARLDARRRGALADEMAKVNSRLRQLASGDDPRHTRLARELDQRFHHCYESAGAGPRLLAKLDALHARRERYVRVYTEALVHAHDVRDSASEHDAVIAALRSGDADAAEQSAMFNHQNALERYRRVVAVIGERGSWS
jgi:DNA-binding GntR family transcriptional regulator